nr:hypothetical protein [Prevotella sp.]
MTEGIEGKEEQLAKEEQKVYDEKEATAIKAAIKEQAREDEAASSNNISLRKIIGGDFLTAQMIRSQIWLIVLIVFFTIVYISSRYSCQQDLIELDKLEGELKDSKYRALSSSSQLTERCRESHVLEILNSNKDSVLHIANQPPYKITVPNE